MKKIALSKSLSMLLLTSALLVLQTGCSVELKDKDQSNNQEAVATPAPTQEHLLGKQNLPEVAVKISALPEINHYQIELSWPPFEGRVRISENSKVIEVLESENSFKKEISGGSTFNGSIDFISADGNIESAQITQTAPKDFVFQGQVILKNDLVIKGGRVLLTKDANIQVRNYKADFDVAEFRAEAGSHMETFPANEFASINTNGLNGGDIFIVAKKASGDVRIDLRGQSGGAGLAKFFEGVFAMPGTPPSSCQPSSGRDGGNAGRLTINVDAGTELAVKSYSTAGQGGSIGAANGLGVAAEFRMKSCIAELPKVGLPGREAEICVKLLREREYSCVR